MYVAIGANWTVASVQGHPLSQLQDLGVRRTDPLDDGQIIFELAWAQGVGCGIMGLALFRKNDIVDVCVCSCLRSITDYGQGSNMHRSNVLDTRRCIPF